jgi:hypothetical protein
MVGCCTYKGTAASHTCLRRQHILPGSPSLASIQWIRHDHVAWLLCTLRKRVVLLYHRDGARVKSRPCEHPMQCGSAATDSCLQSSRPTPRVQITLAAGSILAGSATLVASQHVHILPPSPHKHSSIHTCNICTLCWPPASSTFLLSADCSLLSRPMLLSRVQILSSTSGSSNSRWNWLASTLVPRHHSS